YGAETDSGREAIEEMLFSTSHFSFSIFHFSFFIFDGSTVFSVPSCDFLAVLLTEENQSTKEHEPTRTVMRNKNRNTNGNEKWKMRNGKWKIRSLGTIPLNTKYDRRNV